MIARLRNEPIPIREAKPELSFSEAVEKVLLKGMQRNPDDRYTTAPRVSHGWPRRRMVRRRRARWVGCLGDEERKEGACPSLRSGRQDRCRPEPRAKGLHPMLLMLLMLALPIGAQQVYQPGIDVRDYDISIALPDTGALHSR